MNIETISTIVIAISAVFTAVATVALACFNKKYLLAIKDQAKENREQLQYQIKESAKPHLFVSYPGNDLVRITNVGKGTAYNLKLNHPSLPPLTDLWEVLGPGEFFEIQKYNKLISNSKIIDVLQGQAPQLITVSYQDIDNNCFQSEIAVDNPHFDRTTGLQVKSLKITLQRNARFTVDLSDP